MRYFILVIVIAFCAMYNHSMAQTGKIGIKGNGTKSGGYVKIMEVIPGMPADIAGLKTGDRIYKIDGSDVWLGESWVERINGQPGEYVNLTISRFGRQNMFDVPVPRINIGNNSICEGELMVKILTDDYTNFDVGGMKNGAMSVLHDKTCDFFKYRTYDYEYSSVSDPLMEKELMGMIGKRLDKMGMRQDKNNPDMIIVITFYIGKKEQYVPPQQIVSTKIKQSYNLYWGYIPVPVTETTTTAGYTEVTYMGSIGIKFLDANEMGKNTVPPVIWTGTFTETSSSILYLNESTDHYLSFLLNQFPETYFPNSQRFYLDEYPYTGIWYDRNNLPVISEVNPGSPAYKAGIRKGDKIISINGTRLPVSYDAAGPKKFSTLAYSGSSTGLKYLYMYASTKFKPYKEIPGTLEFKIRRNGKNMTLSVVPEKKQFYKMFKE